MASRKKSARRRSPARVKPAARKPKPKPARRPRRAAAVARRAAAPSRRSAPAAPRPEVLRDIRINVTTIGDLLLTAADRAPDAEALVFPDSRMTYAELAARALERARALQALG